MSSTDAPIVCLAASAHRERDVDATPAIQRDVEVAKARFQASRLAIL